MGIASDESPEANRQGPAHRTVKANGERLFGDDLCLASYMLGGSVLECAVHLPAIELLIPIRQPTEFGVGAAQQAVGTFKKHCRGVFNVMRCFHARSG
jgi:hypothetical protein